VIKLNKFVGQIFVLVGVTILIVSNTVSMPNVLWLVLLGTSLIFSIAGTAILIMQVIKNSIKWQSS